LAYVSPYFVFLHAARAAAATITVSPAEAAAFPAYYAYDGRAQSLFKYGSSGAGSTFKIDRGAGTLEAVDVLVIPSGHNLGEQTVTVVSDNDGAYGSPTTLATFTSEAVLINQALASSTERYLRITFAGTGTWELPEVWFGKKRQPTLGPQPSWTRGQQPNYQRVQFDSGVTGGNQAGPTRWVYGLSWSGLSGTDLAVFTELEASVMPDGSRFYFMPPDGDVGLLLCECISPFRWQEDHPVPRNAVTGPTYTLAFDLIEAIG